MLEQLVHTSKFLECIYQIGKTEYASYNFQQQQKVTAHIFFFIIVVFLFSLFRAIISKT
jgi:uncharacterized membrane protein (DUF373 family)